MGFVPTTFCVQEKRGAAERDERSSLIQVVRRMRDHKLVSDRDEDDPAMIGRCR